MPLITGLVIVPSLLITSLVLSVQISNSRFMACGGDIVFNAHFCNLVLAFILVFIVPRYLIKFAAIFYLLIKKRLYRTQKK